MSDTGQDEKAAGGASEQNTRAQVTNQLPKRRIDAEGGTVTIAISKPRPRWSDDPWCNMTTGEADS